MIQNCNFPKLGDNKVVPCVFTLYFHHSLKWHLFFAQLTLLNTKAVSFLVAADEFKKTKQLYNARKTKSSE